MDEFNADGAAGDALAPVLAMVWPELQDDLLCCVLCFLESHEDLLRLSRVSRRLRGAIRSCQTAWQTLYVSAFGEPECGLSAEADWRLLYAKKYTETCRMARINRRVRLLRMRSDVEEARRCLSSCKEATRVELSRRKRVVEELEQVARSCAASSALRFWQPVEVRQHQENVATQVPVLAKWRETGLRQDLKDIDQMLGTLHKRLKVQSEELRRKRQSLKAFEG